MASYYQNLSAYDPSTVPNGEGMCIGIVVSEWNQEVTHALLEGAVNTLLKNGVKKENIFITHVPGSFELIYASSQMLKTNIDALIAIGCVVRGDTPHFDYICEGTTHGLSTLNTMQDTPVIYGLITTNTMEQALERCGGKFGNKGDECAITALKMVDFKRNMNSHNFHQ